MGGGDLWVGVALCNLRYDDDGRNGKVRARRGGDGEVSLQNVSCMRVVDRLHLGRRRRNLGIALRAPPASASRQKEHGAGVVE